MYRCSLALAVILICAACSSGTESARSGSSTNDATTAEAGPDSANGDDDQDNFVTFDDESPPATEPEPAPDANGEADDREINSELILEGVNYFVDNRDAIVRDNGSLDSLEGFVAPSILAEVRAERDQNAAWVDQADSQARYDFITYTWFIEGEYRGDTLVTVICSERQSQRFGGEIEVAMVDQVFVFDVTDQWELIEIQTRHDGGFDDPGLTCLTPPLVFRSEAAVQRGLEQVDLIFADPESERDLDYTEYFGGPLEASLKPQLSQLPTDRSRVTPTEYRYEPLGLDASLPPFFVKVSVCKHYPEGVIDELNATGEQVLLNEQLVAGVSVEDIYTVFLDPVPSSEERHDVVVDFQPGVSLGCW